MVIKQDFLEMEAKLKIPSVAEGWLSTLSCWETAVCPYPWFILGKNGR